MNFVVGTTKGIAIQKSRKIQNHDSYAVRFLYFLYSRKDCQIMDHVGLGSSSENIYYLSD